MKDLNDMTPDELREYANQKEKQEEDGKAIKTAEAKYNLYYINKDNLKNIMDDISYDWIISIDEIDSLLSQIKGEIELIISKGDDFECINEDGDSWYDLTSGWVEGFDEEWAKIHLTNIKDLRK